MSLSNYPMGVTGNEPQISGRLSADDLSHIIDECLSAVEAAVNDCLADLDDQGAVNSKEYEAIENATEKLNDELLAVQAHLEPPEPEEPEYEHPEDY